MDFTIPADIQQTLGELDAFIEHEIKPLEREHPQFFDHRREHARTDWENGRAFYHPYDRVAAQGHADWPAKYPHLVWNPATHTLVDLLSELHALLHCPDYHGV